LVQAFLAAIVASVNSERQRNGMNPLQVSNSLMELAAAKARDMSMDDYRYINESGSSRAHISPRLGSPLDQARNTGYHYYPLELAARGTADAESTMRLWLNSPGHKVWITDRNYARDLTHIGVGYYYNPDSTYKHYWALILANENQEYPGGGEDPYERPPVSANSPRLTRLRRR